MVQDHERRIHDNDRRLGEHEEKFNEHHNRLKDVEEAQKKLVTDFLSMKEEYTGLKNEVSSVKSTSLQTQNTVLEQKSSNEKYFEMLLSGVIDIKKSNITGKWAYLSQRISVVFGSIVGAGGGAWLVWEIIKAIFDIKTK